MSSSSNWYDRLMEHLKTKPSEQPPQQDVFRKVTDKLTQDPSGLTPLDIVDLPSHQKEVMLLMMRDHAAATQGISMEDLRKRLSNPAHLENTLVELTQNDWLLMMGEAPNFLYKVHLKAKRGSGNKDMWSVLAERLAKRDSKPPEDL
ncbi:MAG: hypothetical protein HY862_19905 [Chloroflexi bacterium]|nr:hypothetical protein [Chloroflexota bacterium]